MAKSKKDNFQLEVRGSVDAEKFKAARTLGEGGVKFELRAMKPQRAGNIATSCIICIVCIICVVCSVDNARKLNLELPLLEGK